MKGYLYLLLLCSLVASLVSRPHRAIQAQSFASSKQPAKTSVINTCTGPLRGIQTDGVNKFLGIPYAEPPTGDNRWKATIPKRPWSTLLNATTYSSMCMQPPLPDDDWTGNWGMYNPSEDCLYLNIWTPTRANGNSKLGVLFWIHGGGHTSGTGNFPIYDGTNLALQDLVVVTVNYRLGIFGFFGSPELRAEDPHRSTGNYAINDLQVALQWVQNNIQAFGGDPKRVTIWGVSSSDVLVLMASPLSRGLFARAIMTGPDFADSSAQPLQLRYDEANFLINATNCTTSTNILQCLRSISSETLLNLESSCSNYLPTIDNYQLTDNPIKLLGSSTFNKVPLLLGFGNEDGAIFNYGFYPFNMSVDDFYSLTEADLLYYGYNSSDIPTILALYPLSNYRSPWWANADAYADAAITCPGWRLAKSYAQHYPTIPLYTFKLNYTELYFQAPRGERQQIGATHWAEIQFIFQSNITLYEPTDLTAYNLLADQMQKYWKAFIETGDVNRGHQVINWPMYKYPSQQQNIVFDVELGLETNFGLDHKCGILGSLHIPSFYVDSNFCAS